MSQASALAGLTALVSSLYNAFTDAQKGSLANATMGEKLQAAFSATDGAIAGAAAILQDAARAGNLSPALIEEALAPIVTFAFAADVANRVSTQ